MRGRKQRKSGRERIDEDLVLPHTSFHKWTHMRTRHTRTDTHVMAFFFVLSFDYLFFLLCFFVWVFFFWKTVATGNSVHVCGCWGHVGEEWRGGRKGEMGEANSSADCAWRDNIHPGCWPAGQNSQSLLALPPPHPNRGVCWVTAELTTLCV